MLMQVGSREENGRCRDFNRVSNKVMHFVIIKAMCFIIFSIISSIRFTKTVATIIPLIEPLSKDAEPVVKQHLVEQLRYLAKVS